MTDKEDLKKMANLHRKISARLNSRVVEGDENTTSIAEIHDAVHDELGIYSSLFFKRQSKYIDLINRTSGYTKLTPNNVEKSVPRIKNIVPYVLEAGFKGIILTFASNDGKTVKSITLNENFMNENYGVFNEVIKSNEEVFDSIFGALDHFMNEYPGFAYTWDKHKESLYTQKVNDGFITCKIDTNRLENSTVSLHKMSDIEIARTRTPEFGELYDYIDMYQKALMEKTPIKVSSLNPFLKTILNKARNYEEIDLYTF